ncbi:MAG: endonuclease III domain-containing protein [Thermomicrobiales bacterium]
MVQSDRQHRLRLLARIAIVADILEETYGPFELEPTGDPLAQLIGTILSQHTSDINTARSYASLRASFPAWEDVVLADPASVVEAIRSGGLANSKAPRIQDVLTEIKERTGGHRLNTLGDMPVVDATRWLTSLHGVGPKTAACVLLFALGKPVMPVDTHVHRIAQRIGFVGPKVNAVRTELVLEDLLGDNPQQVYAFHKGLIAHGKTICKARAPRCAECPLKENCDYYQHIYRHL